jgi:uncharacterized protein YbgA (DUF1722 family)
MRKLVQFHSENKLLLMGYNQKQLRILGNLVANSRKKRYFDDIIKEYELNLDLVLEKEPTEIPILMC